MTMFSNKTLYIPDYVVVEDIPTIINYFHYYNIAKVKSVEVFKHHEPEYYVEDNYNYGYALITIDYYYNNQGARNFYNRIENNKGIIVYDDPKFWEVMFSPFNQTKTNELPNSSVTDYISDDECYYSNEELEESYDNPNTNEFNKKQKINDQLYDIKKTIDNMCTKQEKLLKLLLINNELKSKKQKNKQKNIAFKNVWARRLRNRTF